MAELVNSKKLAGRVAVVTGASSGMGRSAAKALAASGAKVVVVARRAEMLDSLVSEIKAAGGEASAFVGDVSTEEGNEKMANFTVATYGAVHVAFLNAGTLDFHPIVNASKELFDRMFNTNTAGPLFGMKYLIPAMDKTAEKKASIIINTSVGSTAVTTKAPAAVYSATKAATKMLMQYAAIECAPMNIRVNAIAPGIVRTEMNGPMKDEEVTGFASSLQLLERYATPEEICPLLLYLASDDSAFVTGSEMVIDGGWALKG